LHDPFFHFGSKMFNPPRKKASITFSKDFQTKKITAVEAVIVKVLYF